MTQKYSRNVIEVDDFPLCILPIGLENFLWKCLGWEAHILFACQTAWIARQYH